MSKEAQELETRKNHLYRDQYRRTIKGIVAMAFLSIGLTVILVGIVITREQPKYYATTTAGQVLPMHSLSEPVITNKVLLQWAGLATRAAFNMDFVHYQSDIQKAKSDFTPDGWDKFMEAMKQSGLLANVTDQKLVMSAVVSGSPVIVNRAVIHGRFTWRVELPVLVTFSSASTERGSRWLVTMNIQRISTLDAYKGIQISDFKAAPRL